MPPTSFVLDSSCTDLELTMAITHLITRPVSRSVSQPPYGTSVDCVLPLLKGMDYVITHRSSSSLDSYQVSIHQSPTQTIHGFGNTLARAMCFALLKSLEVKESVEAVA